MYLGDILDFDTVRTWEWNSTCPIRNIIAPYIISGLPMYLLKYLKVTFLIDFISPYTLLTFPRLLTCVFSFILGKIDRYNLSWIKRYVL